MSLTGTTAHHQQMSAPGGHKRKHPGSSSGGKASAGGSNNPHRASFGGGSGGKGGKSGPSAQAVAAVKLNPFERLKQRTKFDVLGRSLKGTQRDNGQARSRAIQKRKESLLVELQQDGKRNQFIDRRFGEDDASLSVDDKMMQRFQKERSSKVKFALGDGDGEGGDGHELTHMGTALSQLDDDDLSGGLDGDDDDESGGGERDSGQLTAQQVAAHFGGGGAGAGQQQHLYAAYGSHGAANDPDRPRTKEEVMREVISKAKFFKAERQQEKMGNDELISTLDDQFADIRKMMEYRPTKAEAGKDDAAAGVQDDYDMRARELLFDPKVCLSLSFTLVSFMFL